MWGSNSSRCSRKKAWTARVVIGHCDLRASLSLSYHLGILERGALIEFDTLGSKGEPMEELALRMLLELLSRGFERQILLSHDVCKYPHLRRMGGGGFTYLLDTLLPRLRAEGVPEATLEQMTVENPRRVLTIACRCIPPSAGEQDSGRNCRVCYPMAQDKSTWYWQPTGSSPAPIVGPRAGSTWRRPSCFASRRTTTLPRSDCPRATPSRSSSVSTRTPSAKPIDRWSTVVICAPAPAAERIRKRPTHSDPSRALGDLSNLMGLVIQEAKLAGLNHDQFLELIHSVVGRAYGQGQVRIGMVECNPYDATTLSRDLQEALSCPVEPLLLQDLASNSAFYHAKYDILAVNLAHLHEFEEVLRDSVVPGGADVVALVVTPDTDSLMQIARLPRGFKVGLVCDMEASLQRMKGVLSGYNPSIVLTGCLAGDAAGMRALSHSVKVVVATPSAHPQVRQAMPNLPGIRITFRFEDRSINSLPSACASGRTRWCASGSAANRSSRFRARRRAGWRRAPIQPVRP